MGGTRVEKATAGQSESQNGYPVDMKDLEANQERGGVTT